MNAYLASVLESVKTKHGNEPEFVQTVEEVLTGVDCAVDEVGTGGHGVLNEVGLTIAGKPAQQVQAHRTHGDNGHTSGNDGSSQLKTAVDVQHFVLRNLRAVGGQIHIVGFHSKLLLCS